MGLSRAMGFSVGLAVLSRAAAGVGGGYGEGQLLVVDGGSHDGCG